MTRLKQIMAVVLTVLTALPVLAQNDLKKIKDFPQEDVARMSLDRLGDFYLVLNNGRIRKYDTEGNFMVELAATEGTETTMLEPWNPLRIFRYSRPLQEIALYDRFLELIQKMTVDPSWAIDPVLACPGITNTMWILDRADWSVKMIDPQKRNVIREASLKLPANQEFDFIYMREYQNLLFLADRKGGVLVFNTIGTLLHQFVSADAQYIGVLGEEFYYPEGHKLKFFDLYTEEKSEVDADPASRITLITDERMILVKDHSVEVREFKKE